MSDQRSRTSNGKADASDEEALVSDGEIRTSSLKALVGRERTLALTGLAILCGLAWWYLVAQAGGMSETAGMGGMEGTWTLLHLGYLFVMWSVMMAAMMLPSAAPTILLFDRVGGSRKTTHFVLGYLLVWTAYSAVAAVSQWALHRALLLSPAMVSVSPALSGGLLVAAGAFQFSRLKNLCVRHCRSPLSFLMSHWKEGPWGALEMGARHGAYCVGCCWALMALLFVLGVMNLVWVTVLAVFVLLEKTVRIGSRITRVVGVGLVVWGAWLLLEAGRAAF